MGLLLLKSSVLTLSTASNASVTSYYEKRRSQFQEILWSAENGGGSMVAMHGKSWQANVLSSAVRLNRDPVPETPVETFFLARHLSARYKPSQMRDILAPIPELDESVFV